MFDEATIYLKNWRFQLEIFDFTLSQQTIPKLFVFYFNSKESTRKNEAKIICKAGTFYKGKIIFIDSCSTYSYSPAKWLMETLFAPKNF